MGWLAGQQRGGEMRALGFGVGVVGELARNLGQEQLGQRARARVLAAHQVVLLRRVVFEIVQQ
jgi:hypothetical protein